MPKFSRKHLIAGQDGKRPIDDLSKPLEQKIKFAWKVANNTSKYKPEDNINAQAYLRKLYALPDNLPREDAIKELKILVKTLPDQLPAIPMNRVPKITDLNSALKIFLVAVNKDIDELNVLMDKYNMTRGKVQQIELLQQIYLRKIQIDNKYSDLYVSACIGYRQEIQQNLFLDIQKQFSGLGISSVENVTKLDSTAKTHVAPPADTLPEILANMPPDKARKMFEILAEGSHFDIKNFKKLYVSTEVGYDTFQQFLKKNEISYLGGGNSKNFKITPKDGSEPFVLKVDNRMGMPKSAEAHLRAHSLKDVFTPVAGERQVTGNIIVDGTYQTVTSTLLVTKFCGNGDIESHSNIHHHDETARLESALKIHIQQATILKGISRDGCAFPDMKNTNWLVDENGTVRLADTKSFVFVENDGTLDKTKNGERWFGLVRTSYMTPPEFVQDRFSADKMHAILLGKNLYHYMRRCKFGYLDGKSDGQIYDFSAQIFKTPKGKEVEILLKNLIKPNPADRISVNDALLQLRLISAGQFDQLKIERARSKALAFLDKMKANVAINGGLADDFIRNQTDIVNKAISLTELESIPKKLEYIEKCQSSLMDIHQEMEGIRSDISFKTFMGNCERRIYDVMTPEEDLKTIDANLILMQGVMSSNVKYIWGTPELEMKEFLKKQQSNLLENVNVAEDIAEIPQFLKNMGGGYRACNELLDSIKGDSGENDPKMDDFLQKAKQDLLNVKTPADMNAIKSKLKTIANDPQMKAIKDIIQNFRDNDTWYTVGMGAKADRIEAAMAKVPVEERGNILRSTSEEAKEVRKALASHRHFWRSDVYLDEKNEVDVTQAATTFRDFKNRFSAMKDPVVKEADKESTLKFQ